MTTPAHESAAVYDALSGARIVEMRGGDSGAFCGQLLAQLGGEVFKLQGTENTAESAGRLSLEEQARLAYLDRGKRAVALPSGSDGVKVLAGLVRDADVVICDLDSSDLRQQIAETILAHRRDRLIWLEISPFGSDGPWVHYSATPFTTLAASGALFLEPSGKLNRPFYEHRPPVRWGGSASENLIGVQAAAMVLAALHARSFSGKGQRIEISKQEALMHVIRHDLDIYFREKKVRGRAGSPGALRQLVSGTMRCRDGYVALWPLEPYMIENLARLMGSPGWSREPWFADVKGRDVHAAEMREDIERWVLTKSMEELRAIGLENRIALSPVYEPADVIRLPQYKARQFFRETVAPNGSTVVVPGLPFTVNLAQTRPEFLSDGSEAIPAGRNEAQTRNASGKLPRTGWAHESTGPLKVLRIAEFTHWQAGPASGMILSTLGAEVIKIESAERLDQYRRYGETIDESFMFSEFNMGKLSVRLNLKHPEGAKLARRLVLEHCDAMLSNLRAPALENVGLGWRSMMDARPDLVTVLISNAGTEGPEKDQLGYATTFVAGGGLAALTGYEDGPPAELVAWPDTAIGIWGAFAMASGLLARSRNGKGGFFDLSGREGITALIGEAIAEASLFGNSSKRRGNRDRATAPHECYPCAGDDAWVAIAITTDEQWRRFSDQLPEWARASHFHTESGRNAHRNELDRQLGEWTRQRSAYEVTDLLQEIGIAASPVFSNQELAHDRHAQARGSFVEYSHPFADRLTTVNAPWRFSATPVTADRPAPWLGEHDNYVLSQLLGLSEDEIVRLREIGACV